MGFEGSPFQHCACRMPGKQCRKTPGARKEFPCFLKNRPCYGDLRPGRFPTPDSVRLCESLRLSSGLFPMDLFSPGVQDGEEYPLFFPLLLEEDSAAGARAAEPPGGRRRRIPQKKRARGKEKERRKNKGDSCACRAPLCGGRAGTRREEEEGIRP